MLVSDIAVTTALGAQWLNVSPATIRSWTRRGLVEPVRKVKGANYYRWADLLEADRRTRRSR